MRKAVFYGMGSLFFLFLVSFCLYWVIHSCSANSHTQNTTAGPEDIIEGIVFVNGTTAIGRIDDDFVCATLDWWPPDKCDYGTCSWGQASILNLVSSSSFLNMLCFFFIVFVIVRVWLVFLINHIRISLYHSLY
jgi:hypothetical protein